MDFDGKIGSRIIYASTDDAVNSAQFELESGTILSSCKTKHSIVNSILVPTISTGVTAF